MKLFYSSLILILCCFIIKVFPSEDSVVYIQALDLNRDIVADVSIPYSQGYDGFDYMLQGKEMNLFDMLHSFLGPFPVIASINGVRHDLRETGWCLSYETREGKLYQNVGLKELKPQSGDKLIFNLLQMGTFPDKDEINPKKETEVENSKEDNDESFNDEEL